MRVTYTLLESGYHSSRAIGWDHLFAQWPVGAELTKEHVGYGEYYPGKTAMREFIEAASAAAERGGVL